MVIQAYKLMSVAGPLEARPHAAGALEALVLVVGELLGYIFCGDSCYRVGAESSQYEQTEFAQYQTKNACQIDVRVLMVEVRGHNNGRDRQNHQYPFGCIKLGRLVETIEEYIVILKVPTPRERTSNSGFSP